jgi:hypothetical protein
MQLPDNVGNIGLLPVLLQALVDNVDGIPVGSILIDPLNIEAGLEFLEHCPAHDLEAFAALIVFIHSFLTGHDGGISLKTSLCKYIIQRSIPFFQK